ncbi:alpha/beta hydrolase [Mycobacterium triplex]|uniref:Alpha/beta hydrolase n=1 Tax=Mycobacterium triplex TaxID=47839 RepID=A0A024JZ75_9MYCO|nr:alpha/beta fold hydrolase [Mycobacterium triplex]ORX05096.1 alpha/beta hydrolase [Mycobacterium triplex]CDO89105.1 alpha/beta hydrolase fold protein [Mycobacterium triplex]
MIEPELLEFKLPHVQMSALAWGPRDGRLALCVHGFPDSAHSWRFVAPALAAKGFRVVAPFTRGYAPTGPAPDDDYHLGALMTDLIDLHKCVDGGSDAVLIGHDWGCFTANGLAAFAGSPFCAYVSMAAPPLRAFDNSRRTITENLRMSAIQLRRSWYVLFFQLPLIPERLLHRVIPRLWKDWSPPDTDVRADVARTLAALPTLAHRKAAVGYYRAMVRFTHPAASYAGLHRFRFKLPRTPLLVLHGELDGAVQVSYLDGVIDALPPGSRVQTIPGAGHFLQLDQPEAVCNAIFDYLKLS